MLSEENEKEYTFHPSEDYYKEHSALDESNQFITMDRLVFLLSISKQTAFSILDSNNIEYVTIANKTIIRKPQVLELLDLTYVPKKGEKKRVCPHEDIPALQSLAEAAETSGLLPRKIHRLMKRGLCSYYNIAKGKILLNESDFAKDLAEAGAALSLMAGTKRRGSGLRTDTELLYKKASLLKN